MNVLELFKPITTFIFDVDGVLTDGTVLVLENGLQARRMNIKDGFALQMAVQNGYKVLIVSGGNSPQVANRLEKLGITEIYMAVGDKKTFITDYMKEPSRSITISWLVNCSRRRSRRTVLPRGMDAA